MNKYWPKDWKKALPNFLGEDFFAGFDDFESMFNENDENNNGSNSNSTNNNNNNNTNKNNTIENTSGIKVNIYEFGHEFLCIFRLPGLKLNEVDIDVADATLNITGRVYIEETDFKAIHEEIYQGPVIRKVTLPSAVRSDKVDASYNHGYLIVRLHRFIRPKENKRNFTIKDLEND